MTPRAAPGGSAQVRGRLDAATAGLDPVFAVVDLDAFEANADDLVRRAGGLPIRVASKSVRVRALVSSVLERAGFAGVLAYTLPEALWLHACGVSDDIVVAYPTVHRAAIAELSQDPLAAQAITLMVDDLAQVEMLGGHDGPAFRVCLDLDASWRPLRGTNRVHVGVRRSPLHDVAEIAHLTAALARRRDVHVVGVMSYEAQIAGLGDAPPGRRAYAAALGRMQARSVAELAGRRRDAVRAVESELANTGQPPLEFVNGGGTGSLELTAREGVCTELAAGSGLLGPTLFDTYSRFKPRPAMSFAASVVRRPGPGYATVLGGGYLASGPADRARLPQPWLPAGLSLLAAEGAGEVQTPLTGEVADLLAVGDRVWFRHAKAGEACERFADVTLVRGVSGPGEPRIVETVSTYRGEGKTFL